MVTPSSLRHGNRNYIAFLLSVLYRLRLKKVYRNSIEICRYYVSEQEEGHCASWWAALVNGVLLVQEVTEWPQAPSLYRVKPGECLFSHKKSRRVCLVAGAHFWGAWKSGAPPWFYSVWIEVCATRWLTHAGVPRPGVPGVAAAGPPWRGGGGGAG